MSKPYLPSEYDRTTKELIGLYTDIPGFVNPEQINSIFNKYHKYCSAKASSEGEDTLDTMELSKEIDMQIRSILPSGARWEISCNNALLGHTNANVLAFYREVFSSRKSDLGRNLMGGTIDEQK